MKYVLATALAFGLAACTGAETLAPGLTTRMDAPGARLDRAEALGIVNQFRATRGASPLAADPALDTLAQTLAAQYATTGEAPKKPAETGAMRVSAGYANFAETFSGWRGAETEASVLADPKHGRAGLGVAYTADSTYGVYWVMLFGAAAQ